MLSEPLVAMPEESPQFNLAAFAEVLSLRNKQGEPYVLIGGQAVNFWAERFLGGALYQGRG